VLQTVVIAPHVATPDIEALVGKEESRGHVFIRLAVHHPRISRVNQAML
jgi:hypothetical protein